MDNHYVQYLAPGYDRDQVLQDLMLSYGDDVWNFAYYLTKRADAADDIAQDVFFSAYSRLYSFRGEASMKSWLLSITRNKALNFVKTAWIRKVALLDVLPVSRDAAPSAEKIAFDRIASREVWEGVMELPLKFREVVILTYHYHLSIEEIASSLGISEGTVKSRMFRAKKRMASILRQKSDEGGV